MTTCYSLKKYANEFLSQTYGMKLNIPLELNGRLKKAKGRFIWQRSTRQPKSIELNKKFVEHNDLNVVLDVLYHELVHYALFVKGIPHADGQPSFERELKRLGVISQNTVDKYSIVSEIQIYECANCNRQFKMNRRLKNNGLNHRCKCGGKLIDKGKKMMAV